MNAWKAGSPKHKLEYLYTLGENYYILTLDGNEIEAWNRALEQCSEKGLE